VFHTSRPLVALMTLVSLIGLGVGLRRRDPRAQAIFLPLAMALLTLVGAAATASFALRYLVPVVGPLTIGAALAIGLLADAAAERRAVRRRA
jgi:4-amino-4-deoxy-L-arabinose transferase-like glycosyltransferase